MADSFFGFDTSQSNFNDDEPLEPSEDEYDALNNETFGQDSENFDWEVEHEHLAEQLESSRRISALDDADSRLEASLSKLVLDDSDNVQPRALGSNVWRHDVFPSAPTPLPTLKNVCTVEELERQLRQNQVPQNYTQNYYQPRFPPVILQRPPGLQAPVPLPFAPQQAMAPNMNQMNQPMNQHMNQIIGQNAQMNPMGQTNQLLQNHMAPNQMSQNINPIGPNINPIGPNMNQHGQNVNQHGQNVNQHGQNVNQHGQNVNHHGQNVNQHSHNMNQHNQNQPMNPIGQNFLSNSNQMNQFQNSHMNPMMNQLPQNMNHHNQMLHNQPGQNINPIGHNMNQLGQNVNQNMNQMSHNMNLIGQNFNQMGQNMSQVGPNVNQPMNQMHSQNAQMNHIGQNMNQMGQTMNQVGQNQMSQNMNQMGQNQIGQNMNPMGQNQMIPNGNPFGPGMNQFQHMMGQPRMMAPPPGMSMSRQNFNPNMNQFNPNFRAPSMPPKTDHKPPSIMNQQMMKPEPHNPAILKPNQPNQPTQPIQSPQIKNQKPIQRDQKIQKSRIYNNSNTVAPALPQQNLTSQNLVQMIQNTHPMLQYNNSYHNANHHPILNNRTNQNQFGNSFMSHPMFNNQRQNGSYGNARQCHSDDGSTGSDADEYAGLMSAREKQWLVNIQMLQLNTGTPYIHDFYYTVFLERQANKEKEGVKEAHKANQQNHPFYSGGVTQESETQRQRERHNSHRHSSTSEDAPRTYVPTQFENSLGKLQCGSVTAPRKIIDVELVGSEPAAGRDSRAASVASTTNPTEVPREVRRTKQLLLDIEALFLILLRLEELNDPLAISNALILKEREEKQKQLEAALKEAENEPEEDSNLFLKNIESVQRRPKQESPKMECIDKRQVVSLAVSQKPPARNLLDEDKDELLARLFAGLLHGERLQQALTVRKGRALVARFVARVPAAHGRLRALWARLLRALPAAARREDSATPALAPHYRSYIQYTTGWSAVLESCALLSEALDPARTPYVLLSPLTLSCVCALMEKAIILVNTPEATANERQWYRFLKTLARALKCTTLSVAKPTQPLPESKVMLHLKQLESRTTIEILQRGKTAEFGDLTKTDVSEQLVKHLCC